MFSAYVLIVVMTFRPVHGSTIYQDPSQFVTMQEFGSLRACKDASREISKLTGNTAKMVCSPKTVRQP